MKKLLFITHNSNINTSKGARHQNIIRYLGEYCQITVIQYDKFISETSAVSKSNSFVSKLKKIIYRQIIRRFSFPDEFIFIRRWYFMETMKQLKEGQYDIVLIGVPPYSFYHLARSLKKNFPHIKLLIDISDPFYGNVTVLHSGNLLRKMFAKAYEKKFVNLADHIVVLNEEIKTFYERTFGIKNITVIEQGVDNLVIEKISDTYRLNTKQEKNKNQPVVLVYGGLFYKKFREPFELYKAVESSKSNIKLKLFGKINPTFIPEPSDRIEYYGRVSQEDLFREYMQADIIVFIDNAYGIQVPGKTIELMIFNKPILFISSNRQSASIRYFQNCHNLIRVENTYKSIEQALNSIKKIIDPDTFPEVDISGYYWQNLIPKYLTIIN
jgi:hypothetical protein